ncbi:class I SAM-dependent methyltransferase [Corallococcus sp. AB032C]|uniref:class I SAM-dependent methyltransferase n=1 Tax=Corallococcus TaxID=83461 RepID=UPI000ED69D2E|nr:MULTISPECIES: class I SAM-dependent methyltransferase [Corallococcus]NPC51077.1 class I SAM-dependent methyltransferase [Corallococcus exiguus]RKH79037.1 class I SAM-dependent methyltransferase [Corallococcus sp. AB032C]
MPGDVHNWFEQGGGAYARYRPNYPDALARLLAQVSPDTRMALDVGCGNGQFSCQLGNHFDAVVGLDTSADQLAHAVSHERVQYRAASAENLDVADHSISLVTAAQAAHWFDLPRFYEEVRRVCVAGAKLSLISYGVAQLEAGLNERFLAFYKDEVGPYWPPERKLVDGGYAELAFPFRELLVPRQNLQREWDAHAFLGYVSTWSATQRARVAGKEEMLAAFSRDLLASWGDPNRPRTIIWPINIRLGEV